MNKENLVTVYISLLEVADEQKEWDCSEISERAGLELQETEIILDELEHMGFVEKRNGRWHPTIQLNNKEGD